MMTDHIQTEGEANIGGAETGVLDLTDWVFTHSKSELREEARGIAHHLLELIRTKKVTTAAYVGLAALASLRLQNGTQATCAYCAVLMKTMLRICLMPWERASDLHSSTDGDLFNEAALDLQAMPSSRSNDHSSQSDPGGDLAI